MTESVAFELQIGVPNASPEEIEKLTSAIRRELLDLDAISVERARAESAPVGSKGLGAAEIGKLIVTVLPAAIPKVVAGLTQWLKSRESRRLFVKTSDGTEFELTGAMSATDVDRILRRIVPKR